jgi:phospholipase C
MLLSGAAGVSFTIPQSIQRALAINPKEGSTFYDAEHVVILMQENRAFDHAFGTLQGVRGFNDPRPIIQPDRKPVWFQTDALGNTYAPFRLNIKDSKITWMGSLPHSRHSQIDAFNGGKYDKWLIAKRSGNKSYAKMPLTLGYHTRDDLPFYYAMADAFTVCDHNFCSANTSTTPNRSFFWTGKITDTINGLPKAHIRNTDFGKAAQRWKAFPELLQDDGIDWRYYQNEISTGGGWVGEERSWLSNFGLNILENFAAFNVKFKDKYVEGLREQIETLPNEIAKLRQNIPDNAEKASAVLKDIEAKEKVLKSASKELAKWNEVKFAELSPREKELYFRAFTINSGDKNYRTLSQLKHNDNGVEREIEVPKGDVLYQFRKDVKEGKLPAVSWLGAPKNFSDHPSAPWFGSWYVSEIMDILTQNPEVWRKTIFIVTYDENDGYYDHLAPYVVPDLTKPDTGKVSAGIDTEAEMVRKENELAQGVKKKEAREGPIGLGYRVPMLIASPWSRGGKVCSQVFDHTSTLQFLESFFNKKLNKNIRLNQISEWRRTICGDLTAAFRPYTAAKDKLPFQQRNEFIATIHNAKYKAEPGDFKALSTQEEQAVKTRTRFDDLFASQEPGIRPALAIPYELSANCALNKDKTGVEIEFSAGNQVFGADSVGAPFTVYSLQKYQTESGTDEIGKNWFFAVKSGDRFTYAWDIKKFEQHKYDLRLHAPNGFYRQFIGSDDDPIAVNVGVELNRLTKQPSGKLKIELKNISNKAQSVSLRDQSYKKPLIKKEIPSNGVEIVLLDYSASHFWYDLQVTVANNLRFFQQFAGHIEQKLESFTDPLMGRVEL